MPGPARPRYRRVVAAAPSPTTAPPRRPARARPHRRWSPAWLREHPFAADSLLAVAMAAIAVPGLWVDPLPTVDTNRPDAVAVVVVLFQTLPLAWRRRRPCGVLAVTLLATSAHLVLDYPGTAGTLGCLIALYSVAAHTERPVALRAGAASVAVMLGVLLAGMLIDQPEVTVDTVIGNLAVFIGAWVLGDSLRTRRAYVAEVEERARRLEADREAAARQAVTEERARIARELHDIVSHSVSVVVVQAAGARRALASHPDRAAGALEAIEATGRQALDEMRRLLGVLRDPSPDGRAEAATREPQPGLDRLGALLAECRTAGQHVALVQLGEPRPLPAGIDLSAYRVVQESLTNVRKHAGPAEAEVVLAYQPDSLVVTIRDDGRGAAALTPVGDGQGQGLVGMGERLALFGGELRAGPRVGGGYEVRARFPLDGSRSTARSVRQPA